jgi:hypothetical protein
MLQIEQQDVSNSNVFGVMSTSELPLIVKNKQKKVVELTTLC